MTVAFVVTGYSHFPGCAENPTESLVKRLEQELPQRTQPSYRSFNFGRMHES